VGFEGNKTELGFLGLAGVGPGLDTNAGNLTEDSEGFLDFSFAEVDSKVLKVKVVQALSAWVASLELTDSISLGLMEVNEEGVGSIKDKVLGVGTFNSLLGLFGSLVTDESSPFSLLFGGLERFDLTKSFEMLLDESFDFSFRESYGEILNVEVSLSSVIGSLGLRDEELNIESFFLKCAFVESFKSSFSFLDLVETDISVFETVAVFVGSQVSRKDRLNGVEVVVKISDSGVLVDVLNVKVSGDKNNIDFGSFDFSSNEVLSSLVSIIKLFEADVSVISANFLGDTNNLANIFELSLEFFLGGGGVEGSDVDSGLLRSVLDVSLEHNSDWLSSELLVLSVLLGSFGISGIFEVDKGISSGLTTLGVSHDSDEMDLAVGGEEVVEDFFGDSVIKITDIESDGSQSFRLGDEVELRRVHGERIHIHCC